MFQDQNSRKSAKSREDSADNSSLSDAELLQSIIPLQVSNPMSLKVLQEQIVRTRESASRKAYQKRRLAEQQVRLQQQLRTPNIESEATRQRLQEEHVARRKEQDAILMRAAARGRRNGRGGRGGRRGRGGRGGRGEIPANSSKKSDPLDKSNKAGHFGYDEKLDDSDSDGVEDYDDFIGMRQAMKRRSMTQSGRKVDQNYGEKTLTTPLQLPKNVQEVSCVKTVSSTAMDLTANQKPVKILMNSNDSIDSSAGTNNAQQSSTVVSEDAIQKTAQKKKSSTRKSRRRIKLGNFAEFLTAVDEVPTTSNIEANNVTRPSKIATAPASNSNSEKPYKSTSTALPLSTQKQDVDKEQKKVRNLSSEIESTVSTESIKDEKSGVANDTLVSQSSSIEKMLSASKPGIVSPGEPFAIFDQRLSYTDSLPSLPPYLWETLCPFHNYLDGISNIQATKQQPKLKSVEGSLKEIGVLIIRHSNFEKPTTAYSLFAIALAATIRPLASPYDIIGKDTELDVHGSARLIGWTLTAMEPPFDQPSIQPPPASTSQAERVIVAAFRVVSKTPKLSICIFLVSHNIFSFESFLFFLSLLDRCSDFTGCSPESKRCFGKGSKVCCCVMGMLSYGVDTSL